MRSLGIYKGKKVLITGHTGFKGGWLTIWLKMLGANVVGYALDPLYELGVFQATNISNQIVDYREDICDLKTLVAVFNKEKPEIVFHLAAQPLVLESYKSPLHTFEVNTMGTANVLEAIRQTSSVRSAVMITTDKCYENKDSHQGYSENDAMGGHDPYSASKGAAELVISAYRKSFFSSGTSASIASARAGNVMGGGDWSENRLIPDIIKALNNEEIIELRNPHAIRPWQFVLEPLSGYLKLGAKLFTDKQKYAEAWNFGPFTHEIFTVKEVVEKIIQYTGRGKWRDISTQNKPHESDILMLDISKAKQKLSWEPNLSFDECIKLTVDWYSYINKGDMLSFSESQINFFEKKWSLKKE
jgi:CDP-glucose 4,6-dehydratase